MAKISLGHIIAEPGATRTLCGRRRDECGVTWQRWVQAHIDGHAWQPECAECFTLWLALPAAEREPPARWANAPAPPRPTPQPKPNPAGQGTLDLG